MRKFFKTITMKRKMTYKASALILSSMMLLSPFLTACGSSQRTEATPTEKETATIATSSTSDAAKVTTAVAAVTTEATTATKADLTQAATSATAEKTVVGVTDKGYTIEQVDGITYVGGILIANKTYALPSDYNPGELDADTLNAFYVMQSAASKEGLNIYISSGFRSYATQNYIYNNYVAADGKAAADRYSARAGHSEHQTGLCFDLNSIDDSFAATAEGQWVKVNCYKYGFIIRYPEGKEDITGYKYESWHLRYLGVELATTIYESGLTLEEYLGIDSVYAEQ